MIVLIAGANGYIGSRLSLYLTKRGFKIIALYNKHIPENEEWKNLIYKIIKIDVSIYSDIEKLKTYKIDVIINLVSLNYKDSICNPDLVIKTNVLPTWNLLDIFSKAGLKKFIYISTIHVYGNLLIGEINESSPTNPVNNYALTHLLSEHIVNFYSKNSTLECYNIRLSNGYGVPQYFESNCWSLVLNEFCLSAWKNNELRLMSDGKPLRDFINLQDILIGIEYIIKINNGYKNPLNNAINFSSGDTVSILEIAFLIKSIFKNKYDKEVKIFINKNEPVFEYSISVVNKYKINNALFNKLINENKMVNLSKGINEIFDFLDLNFSRN